MNFKELKKEELSPMMQQYIDVKNQYSDCIVFYRLGDFYEMFFDDAIKVSRELELTLTGRECGLSERAPMCGVPYHSYELYLKRLIDLGYKVAICEQMSDPALSKGLVEREVIQVVTPGTIIEKDMLDDSTNNYLCSIYCNDNELALCFADLSTGEASLHFVPERQQQDEALNLLSRYAPVELIANPKFAEWREIYNFVRIRLRCLCELQEENNFSPEQQSEIVCRQFSVQSLLQLGIPLEGVQTSAVCGMFAYIQHTQKLPVGRFTHLELSDQSAYLILDYNALRNLELTSTIRTREKKGSLLAVLDCTHTAMGKRLLKQWIERPLRSPAKILARLDAVDSLMKHAMQAHQLEETLENIYDLERLMTRIIYKKATPRELRLLGTTAQQLPELKTILTEFQDSKLLNQLEKSISGLQKISDLIDRAIVPEPPVLLKDGGVIREGFDAGLDELRNIMHNGNSLIDKICEQEKEKTGIKNLKIVPHKTFGYCLEVTRSYYDKIPDYYIRKQTLVNSERFITEELKQAENTVLGAKDKALQLEQELYIQVRDYLADSLLQVQQTAACIAQIDVLVSFAEIAAKNNYIKPEISIDGVMDIRDGRHPVVEQMLTEDVFVPNDTYLDTQQNRLSIITGPNMSGKSTYMRQTALIVLMAQMGCFVPASYAKISAVDRIFTRVGASDDLSAGESTFMVEMKEVAEILKYATNNSLVILDEVGRGTSTFDGISIARSVAEYICTARHLGCKTLFATHYHELITLEQELDGVKNYSVAVRKSKDGIRFLRKIVPGGTDDSYGIDVAKLAGLPNKVLERAKKLLQQMEKESEQPVPPPDPQKQQFSFAIQQENLILQKLRKSNIAELSDAECREFLEELSALLI